MITLSFALAGLLVGVLLNGAADVLPRLAANPPVPASSHFIPMRRLALWDLCRSMAGGERLRALPRSLWISAGVDLLMALFFAYLAMRYGLSPHSLTLALAGAFFVLIALIDLRHHLVLNVLILPAAAVTLAVQFGSPRGIFIVLLGGAFGFIIFALTARVRPGQIGGGDIKLATLMGMLFGFPQVLWALSVGILAGGAAAGYLILAHRSDPRSQMPYAPFLCLGTLVGLVFNSPLTLR